MVIFFKTIQNRRNLSHPAPLKARRLIWSARTQSRIDHYPTNINISARRKHVLGGCVINNGWEENNADHHIRSLNIKTPGAEQLIMNLSGGNQQKAILGRWLSEEMKVILLDEPTRGIDVGAKHEIYNVIYALAAQGVAVLFASSDLPEVLGVADRIVVMREGEIAGELLHEQADERQALSLAMPKVSQAVA